VTALWSFDEQPRTGDPLLPGATPAAIRDALLTEDKTEFDDDAVAVPGIPVETVRYRYGAPEPVYLVVYLESVDAFLVADVRELVDAAGGPAGLTWPGHYDIAGAGRCDAGTGN
jgi:hypothetical protein